MRINFVNNKFIVDPEMDFNELKQLLTFAAVIAEWDLRDNYKDLKYYIIDGALYAQDCNVSGPQSGKVWWYYDPSVRRWSACDNPNEK
jgi:hypothetical protein